MKKMAKDLFSQMLIPNNLQETRAIMGIKKVTYI